MISVAMPTLRRPHHIGDSIRSLLEGSFSDFELLIQDDGDGSDGTGEAVSAAAAGDPRVRYCRNGSRQGMPGNLNAAIGRSRGELIAVCHDHDLYEPDFLRAMAQALDRHPSALFVHCGIGVISQDGNRVASDVGDWPELSPGSDWLRFMLRSFSCPVCALTLVRRSAHDRYGLYDPSCGFIADVEMWMRLARHGDVAYVAQPLIQVREREQGHFANGNGSLLRTAAMIHRRYLGIAYNGWELPAARTSLEMRLCRELARVQVSRAAQFLRTR